MLPDINETTSGNEISERFLVHFAAFNGFNLDQFLAKLQKEYSLTVVSGSGSLFQTIDIVIRPSLLRQLQQAMPQSVLVSYEKI